MTFSVVLLKKTDTLDQSYFKIPVKFHDCTHVVRLQLREAQRETLVDFLKLKLHKERDKGKS